jgi:hypothetical protein
MATRGGECIPGTPPHWIDPRTRAPIMASRLGADDAAAMRAMRGLRLEPKFPALFTPTSECPHDGPLPRGSKDVCMVCHKVGHGRRRHPDGRQAAARRPAEAAPDSARQDDPQGAAATGPGRGDGQEGGVSMRHMNGDYAAVPDVLDDEGLDRLRDLMTLGLAAQGWSLRALARLFNVSKATISRRLNGIPTEVREHWLAVGFDGLI